MAACNRTEIKTLCTEKFRISCTVLPNFYFYFKKECAVWTNLKFKSMSACGKKEFYTEKVFHFTSSYAHGKDVICFAVRYQVYKNKKEHCIQRKSSYLCLCERTERDC